MPDQEKEPSDGAWFDDFGPMHEVWVRFERGMQILLGVALITMIGFLGESWGGENIPYENIMKAIFRVAWAFAIAVMTGPFVLLLGWAGQLSDRRSKSGMIIATRIAEVPIGVRQVGHGESGFRDVCQTLVAQRIATAAEGGRRNGDAFP